MSNVANTLKETRKRNGLTQKEMAKNSGLNQPQISNIEKCRDSHLSTVIQLADALDLRLVLIPKQQLPLFTSLMHSTPRKTNQSLLEQYGVKDDE